MREEKREGEKEKEMDVFGCITVSLIKYEKYFLFDHPQIFLLMFPFFHLSFFNFSFLHFSFLHFSFFIFFIISYSRIFLTYVLRIGKPRLLLVSSFLCRIILSFYYIPRPPSSEIEFEIFTKSP